MLISLALVVFAQFIFRLDSILESRLFFIYVVSFLLLAGFLRATWIIAWINNPKRNYIFRNRIAIYGAGEFGRMTVEDILQRSSSLHKIIGFIDDKVSPGERVYDIFSVLGNLKNISQVIMGHHIDEIIIAINNITYDRLTEIIEELKQYPIKISVASAKYRIISQKLNVDLLENIPIYGMSSLAHHPVFNAMKRTVDIVGATAGILLLSPVFLLTAIGVKLSSKGPVIFKQTRIGLNGKPFLFYKFRSMTVGSDSDVSRQDKMKKFINGEKADSKDTKIVNEARVTPLGRIIRKYSIDELPQLFNVIKGDMSLVGPRPVIPYEWELLKPWHRRRAEVKPGCSGLWQVSGRSNTNFDDMIILDLYYVDNVSPWFDIEIILKTIPTLLFGHGGK